MKKTRYLVILLLILFAGAGGYFVRDFVNSGKNVPLPDTSRVQIPVNKSKIVEFSVGGGFVGYCDKLIIYSNGNAFYQDDCRKKEKELNIDPKRLEELISLKDKYKSGSQGGEEDFKGPDTMSSKLVFYGDGEKVTDQEFWTSLGGIVWEILYSARK